MTEKEFKNLKVGDRVRFSSYGSGNGRRAGVGTVYPTLGTEGTVVKIRNGEKHQGAQVEWDSSVEPNEYHNGRKVWYIGIDGIEFVEPNLSDDDILKAYAQCERDVISCDECPYNVKGWDCDSKMRADMYALAKRLKEENEKLKKEVEVLERGNRVMDTMVIKVLEGKLEIKDSVIDNLRNSNSKLISQKEKLTEENRDLNAQVKSLSDLLAKTENEKKWFEDRNKEWQKSHSALVEGIREREKAYDELENKYNELRDKYIKSREECDKLHTELAYLEKDYEELKKKQNKEKLYTEEEMFDLVENALRRFRDLEMEVKGNE